MKLTPIIFIILAVGIFFLYIQPQNEKLDSLKEEAKQYEEARKKANELRTKRDSLKDQYKQIGVADQERLKKMIPDTVDNVRLLLDLTNIADEFNIELSQISIGAGTADPSNPEGNQGEQAQQQIVIDDASNGYGTIRIGFSFISTYEDYKRLLRKLELSLRLVDIKQLSVRTSDTALNSYSVSMETYWLR